MMADGEVVPKRQIGNWDFGCVILLLMGFILLILFPRPHRVREASRRASCQNNLKQMGLVFKMYADEHEGYFPTQQQVGCSGEDIVWSKTPDMFTLYPEYLEDSGVLICPSYMREFKYDTDLEEWESFGNSDFKPSEFTGNGIVDACELLEASYTYYGYILLMKYDSGSVSNQSVESFRNDFNGHLSIKKNSPQAVSEDNWELSRHSDIYPKISIYIWSRSNYPALKGLSKEEYLQKRNDSYEVEGKSFPGVAFRLREGIERFLITDVGIVAGMASAQSNIVIMHDRIPKDLELAHPPGGVNVLFMDGHVEFVRNDESGQFVFGPVGEIVQRRW